MYHNGVSHQAAKNDFEGISHILNWLSYIPAKQNAPLPIFTLGDKIDCPIDVPIQKGTSYDPRALMMGQMVDGVWKTGFFDRDSFTETLGGWAKGVVVGRARLGGIPIGVISVETRITEAVIYADPAVETSQEEVVKEAGQVWYPNSAFKTAQAIKDFNYGEQLPLMIFANWRGFSGGQSDMFKEILKFGAQIVDGLREYKQPIFIYIIGELRGGAWVVVDPSINSEMMEMYCYENARGGVLEPEGIVEIKYRQPKIIATMARLSEEYKALKQALVSANGPEERAKLTGELQALEKSLTPIYEQAAVELADLHDRPERMLAKKVVEGVIPWVSARVFFYWRILRRVKELSLARTLESDTGKSYEEALQVIRSWFREHYPRGTDQQFVQWFDQSQPVIVNRLSHLKQKSILNQVSSIASQSPSAFMEAVVNAVKGYSPEKRQELLERIMMM